MAEQQISLNLGELKPQIRPPLRVFAEKVIEGLGDNVKAITVIGSSLTNDYVAGKSDINTVLVLNNPEAGTLNFIRGLAKPMAKKKISAPLLMTDEYICRSLDVFGVEFLQFQLIHKTIYGDDPFEKLILEKKDVRLQCERELKASLIRLRQGYISSSGRKNLLRDILASSVKSLVPLLQAMLWLNDIERPREAQGVLQKSAQEFSIAAEMLIAVRNWPYQKPRLSEDELESAFESIYSTIEQLSVRVDKLEV